MEHEFDFDKEYGLVLEGGGAKGAYQIGVWKAFLECNVKIKGVAGVSVGALNGALITMGNFNEAEKLWSELTYSSIMDVDDEIMGKLMNGKLRDLKLKDLSKDLIKVIVDRGIDITPLKNLINEWVDEEKISNSKIEFVMGAFLINKLKEIEISAWEADKSYLKDYLLASAYLPAFRNERLHGLKYLDGGIINSVPIDMLLNRDYKDIIVVRIYGIGIEKPVKIPSDVNVLELAPRINLGGILEFNPKRIRKNIKLGYLDGLRLLRGLKGKIYYLNWDLDEKDCLMYFFNVNESVKMAFLEYYKLDYSNPKIYNRLFIESVCSLLASTLKLNKTWTYTELLIACIELSAKTVKIQKYNVYTREQILDNININYEKLKENEQSIALVPMLVLKMITIS